VSSSKLRNFLVRRIVSSRQWHSGRTEEREKKAISEAEAKPDTSNSKPANTMAMIAEIVGLCTDIPLKTSANWHK